MFLVEKHLVFQGKGKDHIGQTQKPIVNTFEDKPQR